MQIQHATIGSFQFHYQFSGLDNCLIITSRTEADGNLLLTWMLAWRTGEEFHVEQLREDARYGIGTRQPASLRDFPLGEVIAGLDQQSSDIDQEARQRIRELLLQAQAASVAG